MDKKISILYEDNDIICCEKPPGVSSQSDKIRDFDMVNRLKNYIAQEGKGVPFIGVIHRLDKPVGGIMVFAKNQKALSSLSSQFQNRSVNKKYLAVVTCSLSDQIGTEPKRLTDYIIKNSKTNLSNIAVKEERNAKKAVLEYSVLEVKNEMSLLEVELFTGRHHQIRLQLSHHGMGIWGDTKYNEEFCNLLNDKWMNIALYSYYLEFHHPVTGKNMIFRGLPKSMPFIDFNKVSE